MVNIEIQVDTEFHCMQYSLESGITTWETSEAVIPSKPGFCEVKRTCNSVFSIIIKTINYRGYVFAFPVLVSMCSFAILQYIYRDPAITVKIELSF